MSDPHDPYSPPPAAQPDLFQVQHDVGDVLHHARDRRELVQHAADLHRRDRRALERRQQHAPQRVAERQPEAALEALEGKSVPGWLDVDKTNFAGSVKVLPVREDITMPIQEQLIVELYSR